jgi:two-component system, OmpR family, phosphate regulon response regulator OmpR
MTDAPHILVVDDDRRIRELLKQFLSNNDFRVTLAANAAEARERMEGLSFDLIVLDIMMPGEDGLSLATSLRKFGNATPILMLSALTDSGDRIRGLETGSDDYLGKPFEPVELLLRVRNLLRRAGPQQLVASDVMFGDFTFNIKRGELRNSEGPVRLTTREKDMLRLLAERAGQTVPREDMMQPGSDSTARGVDVLVNRLRQKLEADPAMPVHLQTVRGLGYVLHASSQHT